MGWTITFINIHYQLVVVGYVHYEYEQGGMNMSDTFTFQYLLWLQGLDNIGRHIQCTCMVHVCKHGYMCTAHVQSCICSPSGNAVILLLVALLYFYHVEESKIIHGSVYPVDFLYIIVGVELLFALPCLIYYIGQFRHVDNIAAQ